MYLVLLPQSILNALCNVYLYLVPASPDDGMDAPPIQMVSNRAPPFTHTLIQYHLPLILYQGCAHTGRWWSVLTTSRQYYHLLGLVLIMW